MENEDEPLLTYLEAARLLNLSETTLRRYVSLGRLPHLKLFKSVRFFPSRLREWLKENEVKPARKE